MEKKTFAIVFLGTELDLKKIETFMLENTETVLTFVKRGKPGHKLIILDRVSLGEKMSGGLESGSNNRFISK